MEDYQEDSGQGQGQGQGQGAGVGQGAGLSNKDDEQYEEQHHHEHEHEHEEQDEYDEGYEDEYRRQGPHSIRGGRGGPPPGWMGPRFGGPRGRGFGPGGPRGGPGPGGRPFFPRPPPRHMPPPPQQHGQRFPPDQGPWGPPGMMGGPGHYGPPGMMGPGGPPPHMMGHGGHYMGPPPNMPPQELWVETKTEEGKSYFYHARTRETTWTRPQEGPHVKVITQSEVEAMAQNQMANQNGQNGSMNQGGPMGPNMGPNGPGGMGPGGHMGHGGHMGPGGPMGPMGAMNSMGSNSYMGNNQGQMGPGKDGQGNEDPAINKPSEEGDGDNLQYNSNNQQSAQGNKNDAASNQYSLPPPGFGQWPPQWGAPQWPGGMPAMAQQPPPDLVARAAEWTSHRSPDGRTYYYNAKKQESVWEKPQAMKDLEAFKASAANTVPPGTNPAMMQVIPNAMPGMPAGGVMDVDKNPAAYQSNLMNGPPGTIELKPAEINGVKDDSKAVPKTKDDAKADEGQQQPKETPKPQDKSRPVSSTPISGTPWCVVWTGDGRVFFYNPTAHLSVWERPEQLLGRTDVDRAVSNPPDILADSQAAAASAASQAAAISGGQQAAGIKRAGASQGSESESDNSEGENDGASASKKPKIETAKVPEKKVSTVDSSKEAAIEAEVRASRERAQVPLETRIKSFREMLAEKEVSAFSTWEKELHKIVFDSRYLLLTSKERKQVFDKYVRERAEEERKEKRNRLRQKKDDFRSLLEEAKLHSKSSFSDFAAKYAKDDRFKGMEKMREREGLFNEYIVEVRKREKEEKAQKRDQIKKDFYALLKECKEVDRHARWPDVKKKLDSDPRYKAVDGSALREDYFRDYVKILKEERRKEKDKDRESRSSKKEKKDKDRDRDKDREKHKEKDKDRESSKEKEKKEGSVKGSEEEFQDEEMPSEDDDAAKDKAAKEKAARAEASIKEREREVQRALATSMRDRDKEREFHKRDEAIQHFNALLADLVRNPELGWREAKKQLKKDHRYQFADLLSKEDKERLFTSHTTALNMKRRDKFREMLDELGPQKVSLTSVWRDVRKLVKDDPRYTKFSSSDKCEREFREYIKDKTANAKLQFRTLLQETRALSHRSLATIKEQPNHFNEIEDILSQDARYLVLEHIAEERKSIVQSYLEELEKRGPPPPPTASEPTRRPTK